MAYDPVMQCLGRSARIAIIGEGDQELSRRAVARACRAFAVSLATLMTASFGVCGSRA